MVVAFELGKKTVTKIKQNLFWAFAYNTGLILIAGRDLVPLLGVGIFGWLPMLAAVAMAMSSVTVVGNSILLGRYKPKLQYANPGRQNAYSHQTIKEKELADKVISKSSTG